MITGTKSGRDSLAAHLKTRSLDTKNQVRNLGVILDSDLKFESHIKNVTKTSFFHLRNISRVKPYLSQANTERVMHTFISSKLDYCNAVLCGISQKAIGRLQIIQNALELNGGLTSHQS